VGNECTDDKNLLASSVRLFDLWSPLDHYNFSYDIYFKDVFSNLHLKNEFVDYFKCYDFQGTVSDFAFLDDSFYDFYPIMRFYFLKLFTCDNFLRGFLTAHAELLRKDLYPLVFISRPIKDLGKKYKILRVPSFYKT